MSFFDKLVWMACAFEKGEITLAPKRNVGDIGRLAERICSPFLQLSLLLLKLFSGINGQGGLWVVLVLFRRRSRYVKTLVCYIENVNRRGPNANDQ